MIDWLRPELAEPCVSIGGRELPIAIRRHPRAKRLTMRLARDGSALRITVPPWGRTLDALAFARARHDWIAAQLAQATPPAPVGAGTVLAFRGAPLTIRSAPGRARQPRREGDALVVGGPAERIGARVERWLAREALALFAQDLADYCAAAPAPVPALALSRARRRWGSCALARNAPARHTIRLNWRLVMAPDAVRRSVVAHEVAHLLHFDHSPAFHACLARLFEGDLAAADRWLRHEGPGLYRHFP